MFAAFGVINIDDNRERDWPCYFLLFFLRFLIELAEGLFITSTITARYPLLQVGLGRLLLAFSAEPSTEPCQ